jgi:hypothetical protein
LGECRPVVRVGVDNFVTVDRQRGGLGISRSA